jgi:peptidoglycan/xylan/chitin deacetylase (PgdA/CDA1 family)
MKSPHRLLILFLMILTGCSSVPAAQSVVAPTKGGISFHNTVVSLTFDDGDADNYAVRPILADHNLHATFYIVSGFTNTTGYMTDDQLRGLYSDGNEIGGHTFSHTKLTKEYDDNLIKNEICQDRSNLLAYGFEITSFAYPYGYYDERAKQVVRDCGYNNARIVSGGPDIIPPGDAYALQAMPYIVSDTNVSKMTGYIKEVENEGGGWAIFVFHHVCDGCDQYAVDLETFSKLAEWLERQKANNGLTIKTVDEVVGGEVKPAIVP